MKQSLRITIISLVAGALALAHGGFDHVMGTVSKVDGMTMTVKTDKGDVPVKLDAKTVITKGTAKAAIVDLTPGVRVVVDLPEKVKDPTAASVKIGVAAAAKESHEHH